MSPGTIDTTHQYTVQDVGRIEALHAKVDTAYLWLGILTGVVVALTLVMAALVWWVKRRDDQMAQVIADVVTHAVKEHSNGLRETIRQLDEDAAQVATLISEKLDAAKREAEELHLVLTVIQRSRADTNH